MAVELAENVSVEGHNRHVKVSPKRANKIRFRHTGRVSHLVDIHGTVPKAKCEMGGKGGNGV